MKSVLSHLSFRASSDVGGLFQNMFPDSAIAKKFACSKTKVNYLICFGIALYFKEKLLHKVKQAEGFKMNRWMSLSITFMKTE